MAVVTLQLMGNDIDLTPADLKDLSKASSDLKFLYEAVSATAGPLSGIADGPLGTITLDAGNPSWVLDGSPATFSLQAKATATISLQSKGKLLSYFSDFNNKNSVDVTLAAGKVYLVTEFDFTISGKLSATAQTGAIGISTSDTGSATYTVKNFKAFDPATEGSDAIVQALTSFTLPLHSGTVSNLDDGDALYYEFVGALNLGFGVTYGISTSVGGYSLAEINSTFTTVSGIANVSATQSFTAAASAGLSLKFTWGRTFQCLLLRSKPNAGDGTARLHLFVGKNWDRSVQLSVTGGVSNLSAPQVTLDTTSLTQLALQKLTGHSAFPATSPLQTPLTDIQTEVQKYVTDANNWLSGLAQKANANGQLSLSLLFDTSDAYTSAFTWNFNAGDASFPNAWNAAMAGNFVAAYATGAATLESDSGFESHYTRGSKFTFTFFGLDQFTSVDSYFAKSTVRYGGNGVFYLETNTGKLASSQSNSHGSSTSIYLDGVARSIGGGKTVSDIDIQLHGVLTVTKNAKQMSRLGLVLHGVGSQVPGLQGQQAIALGTQFKSFGSQSTASGMVHIVFTMAALARLQSDAYVNGKQAHPPHRLDAANWNAYVAASDAVSTDPSSYLSIFLPTSTFYKGYDSWAASNCLANGIIDSDGNPTPQIQTDRIHFGNPSAPQLRDFFSAALSDGACSQIINYFTVGQQYLNFCGGLNTVISQANASGSKDWALISGELTRIVGDDIDAWYGPTILLALLQSAQASIIDVQQGKLDPSAGAGTVVISVS